MALILSASAADGVLHDSRVVAREHDLGVAREGCPIVENSRLIV